MQIETGVGDVVDRLTILELKAEVLPTGDHRRELVGRERRSLMSSLEGIDVAPEDRKELLGVNRRIWDTLAEQRALDQRGDFGERFVRVSRQVYQLNDRRAEVKARINERSGSYIREVKVYPENMTKMDGHTAHSIGTIHYHYQLSKEAGTVRARLDWLESEMARLEQKMPEVLTRRENPTLRDEPKPLRLAS